MVDPYLFKVFQTGHGEEREMEEKRGVVSSESRGT